MPIKSCTRWPSQKESNRERLVILKTQNSTRFWPVDESFGETEVRDFEVAARIEEQIFGLEVSVDDGLGVKIFENQNQLARVEQGRGVAEMTCISEVGEQLSTRHVLKEEVKKRRVVARAQSVDGF